MSTHETEQDADQPLGEGVRDEMGTDLRHAMICEAAYRLYEKRGYIDGYALDDWLEAEAGLGHLYDRKTSAAIGRSSQADTIKIRSRFTR
jgi:Protein of unknown function (DUF2934)